MDETAPDYKLKDLLEIMKRLRDPDKGCPWDQKQNFSSIATYTLEEAYEVVDAIEREDLDDLKDELGDLLFQVVYHSEMANEIAAFDFEDVVNVISSKLIRRHPHVFGDAVLESDEDIKTMWERVKQAEKDEKIQETQDRPISLLDDVHSGFPGLVRAVKLQKKAAKVGFDWPDVSPVLEKIDEELDELKQAISELSQAEVKSMEDVEAEFGDLLFVMANLARHLKIDPEAAIRHANQKFIRRFQHIERYFDQENASIKDASLGQMEALWDEAKKLEKSSS